MAKVLSKRAGAVHGVYVGRPSKWGNPYVIGADGSREQVISAYREWALAQIARDPHWLDELIGKDLICWCAPLACHADVLLELSSLKA